MKYYLEGSGDFQDQLKVQELLLKVVAELGDVWFEADKYNLGRS